MNHLKKINLLYPELSAEAVSLTTEHNILGAQLFKFIEFMKKDRKT